MSLSDADKRLTRLIELVAPLAYGYPLSEYRRTLIREHIRSMPDKFSKAHRSIPRHGWYAPRLTDPAPCANDLDDNPEREHHDKERNAPDYYLPDND